MDPNKEVSIAVIKTLIYGNGCSAPVSEEGMAQLADKVRPEATFLTDARFVEDLNDSLKDIESAIRLKSAVDEAFSKLGAKIKGIGHLRTRTSQRNIRRRTCGSSRKCMAPHDGLS